MAGQLFKLMYHPEGGSPREWTIDLVNPAWDVTFATEKATDWPWGVFRERLAQESAVAMQALLWTLRKRDEPKLALASVRFDGNEINYAVPCPLCGEWVSTEDGDEEHECAGGEPQAIEGLGVEPDPEA